MKTKVFIIAGLFLSAFILSGCKTIHQSERIEIHDTLTIVHSDTVREYKYKTVHDTIRESSDHIITLNEKGDTIKEYHYFHEKEKVVEKDSSDLYRSLIDSFRQSLNQSHEKEKVVEKKDWKTEWKWRLIAFAAIVVALLLAIRAAKDVINRIRTNNKDRIQ